MIGVGQRLLALVVVRHVLSGAQVQVEGINVELVHQRLQLALQPGQRLVVGDVEDPRAVDLSVARQSRDPGVAAPFRDEQPVTHGVLEVRGLRRDERLDGEDDAEASTVNDVDRVFHRFETRLVEGEVARARLPLLAQQHVTLAQEAQRDNVLRVVVDVRLVRGRDLPDGLGEERVHGLQLVRLQAVPEELLRHRRVEILHVVRRADRVVQLGMRCQVIDEGERVVLRNEAELLLLRHVDGHVERRLRVDGYRRALRVQEVPLEHVTERVLPYVSRDERAGVQSALLQRIGHALDLPGAVPVAALGRPIEAVLRVDTGVEALPGDVVAVHALALGVAEVESQVLQPLEADLVRPLVLGQAGEYSGVRRDAHSEARCYYLNARAVVHVHHTLVLIESANYYLSYYR